jgi:hypothetical protein
MHPSIELFRKHVASWDTGLQQGLQSTAMAARQTFGPALLAISSTALKK